MNLRQSLRKLVADFVAPYAVAMSRTIKDVDSKINTTYALIVDEVQVAQTAAQTSTDAATSAQASATASATSATASKSSATDSAASAAAATARLRSFNKRWLGDFDADPTTDLNGDAVADGAEYFNTTTLRIRVYYDGVWHDLTAEAAADVQQSTAAAAAAAGSAAEAKTYAQDAADSATAAAGSAADAKNYYDEMVKYGFPLPLQAAYIPRVKADNSGYELRSPADTLTDIGAAPLTSPNLGGTPLTTNVIDWTTRQIVSAVQADGRYVSGGSRGIGKVAADSQILDMYFQASSGSPIVTYGNSSLALASTPQLTTVYNNAIVQAGVAGIGNASTDHLIRSIGVNQTTGKIWLYSNTIKDFIWSYSAPQIDSLLSGYLPLTGGSTSGGIAAYGFGLSNGWYGSSLIGAQTNWGSATAQNVGFYIGSRGQKDNPTTATMHGFLSFRDLSSTWHEWRFHPDTGDIEIQDTGVLFATQTWARNTLQLAGDYATNSTVNTKVAALQSSVNDLYTNKVTTKPNNSADHRISNFLQSNNLTGNGSAGVGLWTDTGAAIYLADISWVQNKFVSLSGGQTVGAWMHFNDNVTVQRQKVWTGTGVGDGTGYNSASVRAIISGRTGGGAPSTGYETGMFSQELSGYQTRAVFYFNGYNGYKEILITENGDMDIPGIVYGTAHQAMLQDLAEEYIPDQHYPKGTLMTLAAGSKDMTICTDADDFSGVISSDPGFVLGEGKVDGQPLALIGKVPVRVFGKVNRKDRITFYQNGVACKRTSSDQIIIGRVLEDKDTDGEGLVDCFVIAVA